MMNKSEMITIISNIIDDVQACYGDGYTMHDVVNLLIIANKKHTETNSALQQQLEILCNQVETLTGQVQQLNEQIQQLKNPSTNQVDTLIRREQQLREQIQQLKNLPTKSE